MIPFPFSVSSLSERDEVTVDPAPPSRGPGVHLGISPREAPWDGDADRASVTLSPLAARELATALLVAAHKAEPKEAHVDALRVYAEAMRP